MLIITESAAYNWEITLQHRDMPRFKIVGRRVKIVEGHTDL